MINMKNLPAYTLEQQEDIADIQSTGYLLRHTKTGARVLLLENEDENKVFNIAFRTTPKNSTGVAHIMEHTVLCGSREFPSKDPFVELVKGSMNTFLNAMTYPDKTMFPVASCNDADFANLMHVYLDAVFYPNIYKKEEIFRQEGWHYQLEKAEDDIVYNGVVYNEMKGAYSSPEDVLERRILNSLFPDNTYAFESGGDPQDIPNLSYEEYLDFHRTYYHPSNSYIYLYGNMDFEERLNWLDEAYLSAFDYLKVDSAIALQKGFDEPVTLRSKYPVAAEDSLEKKTFLAYNMVVGTSLDTTLASAMAVLEYVLLDSPGAPLKEALLKAGIGEDIMSSYDSGICQPVFSIIAKNADADQAEEFRELIFKELRRLAEEGLSETAIRASINMMEFRFREADYGAYPKGLIYGLDVFDSWLYDDTKAFDYLKQTVDYDFLKTKIGTGYYEELIVTYLLSATHATLLIVEPERGLVSKQDEKTREKLAAYKASLSEEEIQELIAKTEKLRVFQETPSTQEELEKIPMLSRSDMKRTVSPIRNIVLTESGVKILHHAYQTNGIAYLKLMIDASKVRREDLPYLSVLKSILSMVSTENYSYNELFNEINVHTGGITPGIGIYADGSDAKKVYVDLEFSVRTLYAQIPYCFEMIEEILFTSKLDEEERLQEILAKVKSRLHSRLVDAGHVTAAARCQSYFSASAQVNDAVTGIEFYDVAADLADHFEERKEELIRKIRFLLETLLKEASIMIDYTGDEAQLPVIREGVAHLVKRLGERADAEPQELKAYPYLNYEKKNEGFKTSAEVQYVARCGSFKEGGFAYTGALRVLRTIMSYDYLWNNIRVVGGAYGCSGSFSRTGEVVFASYRDPHLVRTNGVYEGVPAFLESFSVDERDMTKYVIGTMSSMDTPLNPSAQGKRSLMLHLSGISEEQLQKERDEVLDVTEEDIRALSPLIACALEQENLCVVGNEDKLEKEKALFSSLRSL